MKKMKRVVSVSLGNHRRDHSVETEILGQPILIERIGVDGDYELARKKFLEFDDQVDAFGIGGAELGLNIDETYYPLRSIAKLTRGLKSPVVDGSGIRRTVERNLASWLGEQFSEPINPKRAMFCVASGRYDLLMGFRECGFQTLLGDAGFILGLPIHTKSLAIGKLFAHTFMPLITRLPFKWLYPTGNKQKLAKPRFKQWYRWATVIADDFHYIRRYIPDDVSGKIIVTNTTTGQDLDFLRDRGAAYVCTSTPRFAGRTFGSNLLEAALIAISEKGRALELQEIRELLVEAQIEPTLLKLN